MTIRHFLENVISHELGIHVLTPRKLLHIVYVRYTSGYKLLRLLLIVYCKKQARCCTLFHDADMI